MRSQEGIRKIIRDTAEEMVSVANAKGVGLSAQDVAMVIHIIDQLDYNTTASMQRDVMEGKPSELENFNGYIVKQGKILGVETPTNTIVYDCLLPQEEKARA